MSVPPHVIAASLAALGLHDPGVPVAHLVADSELGEVPLEAGADRVLVFEGDAVRVVLLVSYLDGARRLRVCAEPPELSDLVLLQPGNGVQQPVRDQSTDLAAVAPGLTSVVLRRPGGGGPHRTAWVVM